MTSITEAHSYGSEGYIARLGRAWADWRRFARTVEQLNQLSDRELAGLGVSRSDVRRIARSTVYGA